MRFKLFYLFAFFLCRVAVDCHAQGNTNTPPAFKGGEDSLMIFLGNTIRKPDCEKSPEIDSATNVMVNVYFVVDALGTVGQLRSDSKSPQCFIDEAIRTVGLSSGKWIPGSVNGVSVNMQCVLPISFAKK